MISILLAFGRTSKVYLSLSLSRVFFSVMMAGIKGIGTDLAAKWTSKFNDNKTELEAVAGWSGPGRTAKSRLEIPGTNRS